jgi:hypothetical protein
MNKRKVSTILLVGLLTAMAAVSVVAATAKPALAEEAEAVVTARRLFLRRGPGTEFPPYSTIHEGSTVRVQELQGKWARVTTSSGQTGYVHGDFLRFLEKAPERPAPAAAVAEAPAEAGTATGEAVQRNRELEGEVEDLSQRLKELEADPPAAAPAAESEASAAELARLTAAVASLEKRFEEALAAGSVSVVHPNPMPDAASPLNGSAILFGFLGLVIGWAAGSYVRRSDRGRSRIRL